MSDKKKRSGSSGGTQGPTSKRSGTSEPEKTVPMDQSSEDAAGISEARSAEGGSPGSGASGSGASGSGASDAGSGQPSFAPRAAAPKASMVKFKAALRREIRKKKKDPEIDYLNITAMLDLMTIILVFLLQSMASSAASIQENDDMKLARSVMSGEPSDQGVILVISKSAILIGEDPEPVVKLPNREQLASTGLDAQYKRSGPTDPYIVPLARRLESAHKLDKAVRAAKGKPIDSSEAIIIADATTPFRLLIEVLYTLGQSHFGKYHLMVMRKKG